MDPERLRNSANLPPGLRSALSSGASRPLPLNTRQRLRQRVLAVGTVGAVASAAAWTGWAGWAKASAVVLALAGATAGGVFFARQQQPTLPEMPRAAAPPVAERAMAPSPPQVGAEQAVAVPAEQPANPQPVPRKRAVKRTATTSAVAAERIAAPPPALDLAAETRLLSQAQAALHVTPAVALAATDKHVARFPNGLLLAERELLAAEALLRLERVAEAEGRLRALIASQPGAIYTQRARRLMGSRAR